MLPPVLKKERQKEMLPVIGERRCFIVICRIFIANILSQYKWL